MFNSPRAFFDAAVANFFDYAVEHATIFDQDYLLQVALNWNYDLEFVDLDAMVRSFDSLLEPNPDIDFS